MSDSPNAATADLSASWPGLSQLQQLIHNAKLGVQTLDTLISTPAAAAATGSPPASAAIAALGIELAIFLAQTIDAMDDDIATLERTARNYQLSEREVLTGVAQVVVALSRTSGTTTPTTTPATTGTTTATTTVTTTATRPRIVGTRERVVPPAVAR